MRGGVRICRHLYAYQLRSLSFSFTALSALRRRCCAGALLLRGRSPLCVCGRKHCSLLSYRAGMGSDGCASYLSLRWTSALGVARDVAFAVSPRGPADRRAGFICFHLHRCARTPRCASPLCGGACALRWLLAAYLRISHNMGDVNIVAGAVCTNGHLLKEEKQTMELRVWAYLCLIWAC